MKYILSENAEAVIKEAAATVRIVARLFSDNTEDVQFEGEDFYALRSILGNLAEKLLDLQVEADIISNTKK